MILAHHAVFGAYGFWLPNDPRGSGSDYVRSARLFKYGSATKVTSRSRSRAHTSHDKKSRLRAKSALRYPAVRFTGRQAMSIAKGFAEAAHRSGYVIHSCAILPDHVHLVIAAGDRSCEQIIQHLKGAASRRLRADGLHPFAQYENPDGELPSPWQRKAWNVFLNTPGDVCRAINYVEQNPVRDGLKRQRWSFVAPYVE